MNIFSDYGRFAKSDENKYSLVDDWNDKFMTNVDLASLVSYQTLVWYRINQ